jgi:hypothetical protein
MASPIESTGFMHGLHNYPKLPKPGGGFGICHIAPLLFPLGRGRFRRGNPDGTHPLDQEYREVRHG